jgi:hypothetical protein
MTTLDITSFGGEIPRLPATVLPANGAQLALNCDLAHVELRGLRGAKTVANGLTYGGAAITSIYTEDGINFFAWPYDTYVVKSMVVGDQYYRIYYNALRNDGSFLKVARLARWWPGPPASPVERVIGTSHVGGNYKPPEASSPAAQGGNSDAGGPDSWLLGVTPPRVQGVADTDLLVLKLDDKPAWPGIPKLQLRVTYFLEDLSGQVVAQQDVSNTDHPDELPTATSAYPQILSSTGAGRGNKVQDTFWAFASQIRPYKNYWFDPPDMGTLHVARTPVIFNTGAGPINIEYGSTTTDPSNPGMEGPGKEQN